MVRVGLGLVLVFHYGASYLLSGALHLLKKISVQFAKLHRILCLYL